MKLLIAFVLTLLVSCESSPPRLAYDSTYTHRAWLDTTYSHQYFAPSDTGWVVKRDAMQVLRYQLIKPCEEK